LDQEEVLDVQVDEFVLVFLCDIDLVSVFLEVLRDLLAKNLVVDREGASQYLLQRSVILVVEDVLEALPDVRLPLLQVVHVQFLVQKYLVASRQYRNVENDLVLRRKCHKSSNELEVKR
jgi:hypothetical protein